MEIKTVTKEQKAVCDRAWELVEKVRQLEDEGSDKAMPSSELQPYVSKLADAVYDADW